MVKGLFHIAVGVLFMFARPINSINFEDLRRVLFDIHKFERWDFGQEVIIDNEAVTMFTTSWVFVAIGGLFVLYGIYILTTEGGLKNGDKKE